MLRGRTGAVMVSLVFLAGLGAAGCSGEDKKPSAKPSSSSRAPTLTDARAETMVKDVSSGDRERVRSAVAIPKGAPTLSEQAVKSLRELSGLEMEPSTFKTLTSTTATVRATLDGASWLVYLVLIDQTWKISLTQRLGQ